MNESMRAKGAGFTLVELMIVVSIVGVLAVLAAFGVRKYLSMAKGAEARNAVGGIARNAGLAFDREATASSIIAAGSANTTNQRLLCSTAVVPVPAVIASVSNRKYQSSTADWAQGSTSAGWKCLKFSMDQPQYYLYSYQATNVALPNGTFTATASGDLDGNGVTSSFEILGAVQNGQLAMSPNIAEVNPEE